MTARAYSHGPSFLRWAGSKRQSLKWLASAYSDGHGHYVEPFAGSAALFFFLRPDSASLADLNHHLINALAQVRDRPAEIYELLQAYERSRDKYYEIRTQFNALPSESLISAVRFIYLNRNCFNGLWRTNASGKFNVPYGGLEMGGHPPLSLFETCSLALQRATLKHQDFRETVHENSRQGVFIYADPPYFNSEERVFIEYGKESFGRRDLDDLIDGLLEAAERGATVVLTYHAGMHLPRIPSSWNRIPLPITRNVGGFKGSRRRQVEILYTNSNMSIASG